MKKSVKADLKRLFELLDSKEESDSGHIFSPTCIHSCRTMHIEELSKILPRLRSYALNSA